MAASFNSNRVSLESNVIICRKGICREGMMFISCENYLKEKSSSQLFSIDLSVYFIEYNLELFHHS